jgi:hypothetical protein
MAGGSEKEEYFMKKVFEKSVIGTMFPGFKKFSSFKKGFYKIILPLVIKKYKPIRNYNVG